MAEVLEHQPEPGAQPALPGTWTPQVLAAGDHGGSDLQRAEGGTLPQPSGKVRSQHFLHFLSYFFFFKQYFTMHYIINSFKCTIKHFITYLL